MIHDRHRRFHTPIDLQDACHFLHKVGKSPTVVLLLFIRSIPCPYKGGTWARLLESTYLLTILAAVNDRDEIVSM